MLKKPLFLLCLMLHVFFGVAQQEVTDLFTHAHSDTLCVQFRELSLIDFEVTPKSGCEYLITQLFNHTTQLPDDSLSYFWCVFNDDGVSSNATEENPDIFIQAPGNYHVALIITNLHGCSDTLIKYNVISVDKMPQIDFTFTPENSLFAEYFGEVEFTNLTNPDYLRDTTMAWHWDFGDHIVNNREWSPLHLFSTWGDYPATFYLSTKNGCKVARTKTVIIEDELFFPDTLRKNANLTSSIFAITNLNTNIPDDDPTEFRTNFLYIYNESGEKIFEQKNYDSYIKNEKVVEGKYALRAEDLREGVYYYSFYYHGKSKIVHYSGVFWVR